MARIVFVNSAFPTDIDYPEVRPIRLARDWGHDVTMLSLPQDHPGFAGIATCHETTTLRIARRLVRLRADLAFFERPGRLLIATPAARRAWVRAPHWSPRVRARLLQSRLLARSAAVTFTNPWEETLWRVPPSRLADLPYPVDLAFWQVPQDLDSTWWAQWDVPAPEGVVIVSVANLTTPKQLVELVCWSAPFLRSHPSARLVLPGRAFETDIVDRIKTAASGAGLLNQVQLLGGLSPKDIRRLLAWADVHVVNSRLETQCMAMYEGLAAGVPTMLFDYPVLTSAFPELPRHHDGQTFLRNLHDVLSRGRRPPLTPSIRNRLEWADIRRHDGLFSERLSLLCGDDSRA